MYLVLDPRLAGKSYASARFEALGLSWTPVPRDLVTPENVKKSADFWMKALEMRG